MPVFELCPSRSAEAGFNGDDFSSVNSHFLAPPNYVDALSLGSRLSQAAGPSGKERGREREKKEGEKKKGRK